MSTELKNIKDTVSILMPAYNVERYIKKCLDSVLNQDYIYIEAIVVNDGSTDQTLSILKEYKKIHPCLKILNQKNKGLASARNLALENASGSYVTFVDTDDWIAPNFVSMLVKNIKDNSADISVCRLNTALKYFIKNNQSKDKSVVTNGINGIKKLYDEIYYGNYTCGKLYKIELFDNYRFPNNNRYLEDKLTTPDLFYKAKKIVFIGDALYFYRQNSSALTFAKNDYKKIKTEIEVIENLMQRSYLLELNNVFKRNIIELMYIYKARTYLNKDSNDKQKAFDLIDKTLDKYFRHCRYSKSTLRKVNIIRYKPYRYVWKIWLFDFFYKFLLW